MRTNVPVAGYYKDITALSRSMEELSTLLGYVWLDGMIDEIEWSLHWSFISMFGWSKNNRIVIPFGMFIHYNIGMTIILG